MTTGLMKIIDACGFSSGGASTAGAGTGNIIIKGRAQAVFVPGMLKEERKKAKDAAAAAQPSAGAVVPAPAAVSTTPSPAPRPTPPRSSGSELQSVFGNSN